VLQPGPLAVTHVRMEDERQSVVQTLCQTSPEPFWQPAPSALARRLRIGCWWAATRRRSGTRDGNLASVSSGR
jgi:hypothetical protein